MVLNEKHVLKHWEKDWEEGRYFHHLNDGDSLGYDYHTELFSLNNYWNEIPFEEANRLYREKGLR